jgi:hypothetical protein
VTQSIQIENATRQEDDIGDLGQPVHRLAASIPAMIDATTNYTSAAISRRLLLPTLFPTDADRFLKHTSNHYNHGVRQVSEDHQADGTCNAGRQAEE